MNILRCAIVGFFKDWFMHIQILKRKKMSRFSKFKKGSILVESEAMKGGKIFFFPFCKVGSAIPTGGE